MCPRGIQATGHRCYSNLMVPRHELEAKLHARKKSDKAIQNAVARRSREGVIKRLWVMSVPYSTPSPNSCVGSYFCTSASFAALHCENDPSYMRVS